VRRLPQRSERGQATVEFVFVSLMLVLFLMLTWQMAWVACQKWYFNYVSAYSARVWAVRPLGTTTLNSLLETQLWADIRSPGLLNIPFLRVILPGTENDDLGEADVGDRFGMGSLPPGIRYRAWGTYLPLFSPSTLGSAGFEAGTIGVIPYETYIPIEHEESFDGPEDPNRYDNDRSRDTY
jgi:TadE-like protein